MGTVVLDQVNGYFDINCEEVSGPFRVAGADGVWDLELPLDHPVQRSPSFPELLPQPKAPVLCLRD